MSKLGSAGAGLVRPVSVLSRYFCRLGSRGGEDEKDFQNREMRRRFAESEGYNQKAEMFQNQ